MKFIDSKLYVEFPELVEAGVSANYLSAARTKGVRSLRFMDDPDDRRRVLVDYEHLSARYKEKIKACFGDPYEYIAREPIRRMITRDLEAEKFYISFRFENGQSLPDDKVAQYCKAADFLNLLKSVEQDKAIVKKQLNLSLASFYTHAADIIKSDGITLPTKYQLLKDKVKKYISGGYDSLIEKWRFNNSYAAKVADELSESVLLELIGDNRKVDDVKVSQAYNKWATANGYKPITDATVGNWRRQNEFQVAPYRDGNKAWYNKYGKHLLRNRPSAPLLLIGGDGNDWDMFFQTRRKNQVYYFDKFVLVVVMDAFNDYVLGWSIGQQENINLIKAAYFDALCHIKELTGGYYLPHQLQQDRFSIASLKDFYSRLVENFHPAAAKAPRGKYIERAFGTTWHQILRQYKNYSGHNITARTRINADRIDQEKKNFPHSEEAFVYAQDFIRQLRQLECDGVTKEQRWLAAFNASEKSQSRLIGDEQFLLNFGYENGAQQTITNRGLSITINGTSRLYEIPNEHYLTTVGKTVTVKYDPYDLSRVLVTDDNKIRFVAGEPNRLPAAKADYQPGDEARFWKRLHQKKLHLEQIAASKGEREQILIENGIDAEALLQAGVMVKELKQRAEIAYTRDAYQPIQIEQSKPLDPLDQM